MQSNTLLQTKEFDNIKMVRSVKHVGNPVGCFKHCLLDHISCPGHAGSVCEDSDRVLPAKSE